VRQNGRDADSVWTSMFADLLVVCSFLFICRTWFGAQVNLVSGTEPFRHTGGLDNVSTSWLLPTLCPRGRSSSKGAWGRQTPLTAGR